MYYCCCLKSFLYFCIFVIIQRLTSKQISFRALQLIQIPDILPCCLHTVLCASQQQMASAFPVVGQLFLLYQLEANLCIADFGFDGHHLFRCIAYPEQQISKCRPKNVQTPKIMACPRHSPQSGHTFTFQVP